MKLESIGRNSAVKTGKPSPVFAPRAFSIVVGRLREVVEFGDQAAPSAAVGFLRSFCPVAAPQPEEPVTG